MIPTQQIYISDDDYVKFVYLSQEKGVKVIDLLKEAVAEYLKKQEVK